MLCLGSEPVHPPTGDKDGRHKQRREYSTTLLAEVSLYTWPYVLLVWHKLLSLCSMNNSLLVWLNPNRSNCRSAVQWYIPWQKVSVFWTNPLSYGSPQFRVHLTTSIFPLSHPGRLLWPVWPDWAIYWTLGKFSKPLAAINLPKSLTFLGNFCKGVQNL